MVRLRGTLRGAQGPDLDAKQLRQRLAFRVAIALCTSVQHALLQESHLRMLSLCHFLSFDVSEKGNSHSRSDAGGTQKM